MSKKLSERKQMWSDFIRIIGAPLIAGIVAAYLTTYLGARFSFDRFRKEQWWQEKRRAYDAIVKELARIKFNASAYMASTETGGEVDPGRIEGEKDQIRILKETAASGAYIVSSKTVQAVESVIREWSMPVDDPYEEASRMHDTAEKALETVRAESRRDLGIREE